MAATLAASDRFWARKAAGTAADALANAATAPGTARCRSARASNHSSWPSCTLRAREGGSEGKEHRGHYQRREGGEHRGHYERSLRGLQGGPAGNLQVSWGRSSGWPLDRLSLRHHNGNCAPTQTSEPCAGTIDARPVLHRHRTQRMHARLATRALHSSKAPCPSVIRTPACRWPAALRAGDAPGQRPRHPAPTGKPVTKNSFLVWEATWASSTHQPLFKNTRPELSRALTCTFRCAPSAKMCTHG
jgi:hypothetical protein